MPEDVQVMIWALSETFCQREFGYGIQDFRLVYGRFEDPAYVHRTFYRRRRAFLRLVFGFGLPLKALGSVSSSCCCLGCLPCLRA